MSVRPQMTPKRMTVPRPRMLILTPLLALVAATALVATPSAATASDFAAHMADNNVVLNQTAHVVGNASGVTSPGVTVQRGIHGVWTDRQSAPIKADGSFDIAIRPSQTGIYALRVRGRTDDVVTNVFYFRVAVPPCTVVGAQTDLAHRGSDAAHIDRFSCGNGWAAVGFTTGGIPDEISGLAHWGGTKWAWATCPAPNADGTFDIPKGIPATIFTVACETN